MLDKIRQLERLLEPEQNDYLSALRERIHPIKGKASLGEYSCSSYGSGYESGSGSGYEYGYRDGNGIGYGDGYLDGNGIGDGDGDGVGDGFGGGAGDGYGYGEYGHFYGDGE